MGSHELLFPGLRKGSGTIRATSVAGTGLAPCAQDADDCRQDRKNDHHGDHVMNALRNVRNQMAKEITAKDHGSNPEDAAKNIECQISSIRHLRRAGNRRAKGANDRHKTSKNHGSAAIFFVKIMRALQMAAPEEKRIFAPVKRRSRGTPDPVADLVAGNRAKHHRRKQPLERNYARGRENAGGNQQGITGKEKAYKESSLDENNRANQRRAAAV